MEIFSILTEIEEQALMLEGSQTILSEIAGYMECNVEEMENWQKIYFFEYTLPRMKKLLFVATHLIYEVQPQLELAVNELLKCSKENKK